MAEIAVDIRSTLHRTLRTRRSGQLDPKEPELDVPLLVELPGRVLLCAAGNSVPIEGRVRDKCYNSSCLHCRLVLPSFLPSNTERATQISSVRCLLFFPYPCIQCKGRERERGRKKSKSSSRLLAGSGENTQ